MGKGQKYKKCESRRSKDKYVIEKLEKKNRENGKDKQRAIKQNNKE